MKIITGKFGLLVLVIFATLGMQSCKNNSATLDHNGGKHSHQHADGHSHSGQKITDFEAAGFVKLNDTYFKLAPDIAKNGESHMDFYIRDLEGKHVSGAEIKLNITSPKGKVERLTLQEDKAGEHYHTKLVLTEAGEYSSVAEVKIGELKLNPRFSFSYLK